MGGRSRVLLDVGRIQACAIMAMMAAWLGLSPSVARGESLTLEQAIETAAHKNPTILEARAEIEAATGRKLQAEAFADPRLVYEPEEASGLDPGRFGSQKIGVSERFELFGKRGLRGRIAGARVEIARQKWRRAAMLTGARVKRAYWKAAAQRDVVSLLVSMQDVLREILGVTRAGFASGSASYADVARAKIEIAELDNELIDARTELNRDKSALNLLLGRAGDASLDISSSLRLIPEKRSLQGIRSAALRDRPSLLIAGEVSRAAEDSRRLARSSYLPDLDISGSYQRVRSAGLAGDTIDHDWTGVLALSFPFPGAKRQRGLVREADAERGAAVVSGEAAKRELIAAIDQAYASVLAAQAQVQHYEEAILPEAEDGLHSGIDAYKAGQVDSLGLLDLYRAYKKARIGYTRSLLKALMAQADLDVAGEEEEVSRSK